MGAERLVAPPRGTRPSNRRVLLRLAAADLFASAGYANVSMADVASAVNMSPSSVYKHYTSKADLLFGALDDAMDDTLANLPVPGTATLPEIGRALAKGALDNRASGVLLQRESRHLAPERAASIRKKRGQIASRLASEVAGARPELDAERAKLLALCAIDVVSSVSFHRVELPQRRYEHVLGLLATTMMMLEFPQGSAREAKVRQPAPQSRLDEILDAAVTLFAERGFAEVGIEDIGAAVGMAGPSLYHHVDSKQAILVGALRRGHDRLRGVMRAAAGGGTDAADALRLLTDGYVNLAFDQPDLITVLITEPLHLHIQAEPEFRAAQRAYIADWIALAQAHRPGEDRAVTRIKVQAAQMLANDIARTSHLRRVAGLRSLVREAAWAVQQ